MVTCIVPPLLLDNPFEILGIVAVNNGYLRFIALMCSCDYAIGSGNTDVDRIVCGFMVSIVTECLIKCTLRKEIESKLKI